MIQLVWLFILVATLVLVVAAIPARLAQLNQVAPVLNILSGTLGNAEVAVLQEMGISIPVYAVYVTGLEALSAVGGILVGAIIFWRQRQDWIAIYVSIALITLGTFPTPLMTSVLDYQPALSPLIAFLQFIAFGPGLLVLYLFPDGRFVPRWTLLPWILWMIYAVSWQIIPALKPPLTLFAIQGALSSIGPFLPVVILIGIYGQIYRYRRVSTPLQRQQTKWVVLGFSIVLVLLMLLGALSVFVPFTPPSRASMLFLLLAIPLVLLGLMVPPLVTMISILKFHLWDIDLLIRRTVTYTLLAALLAVFYFGSIIFLQRAFASFTGQRSELATVLSTLAIAALFVPLRNRIQSTIDRRFYRKKYDARQVLEQFGQMVRNETDLERLTGELMNVVQETMHPKSVSMWLRKNPRHPAPRPAQDRPSQTRP